MQGFNKLNLDPKQFKPRPKDCTFLIERKPQKLAPIYKHSKPKKEVEEEREQEDEPEPIIEDEVVESR